ncbi:MAG: hypothetical protein R6X15_04655 [Pseudomonadota bacterium]
MHRHFHKQCATALLLLSLAGCDFRGSSNVSSSDASDVPVMVTGQSYPVTDGSRVVSTSPTAAQVQITHELIGQQRTVTLLQGSAELYP